MGLQVRILLYAEAETRAFEAATAAFAEIARLDDVMSDYRAYSELSRLSNSAVSVPVRLSPDLYRVLAASQRLAELSDGAFDVTVGPLVALWRLARREGKLPEPAMLDDARRRVSYQHLQLNAADSTATLAVPGMQLDLGGIAKGYAADRAMDVLRQGGAGRALIEIGGDARLGDPPPGRNGWRIEIAHAADGHRFVELSNAAMASSGDTEQFVELDGMRYSHVLDPATGVGLTDRIAVTVIAPDGLTADAIATAISVLGPEKGEALIQAHYPEAEAYVRFIGDDGESVYSTARTR